MSTHPNRGWRGRWTVDQAAREARHGPSGLVVRFPGAVPVNGQVVLLALQEKHGREAGRMLRRLAIEAATIYEERTSNGN